MVVLALETLAIDIVTLVPLKHTIARLRSYRRKSRMCLQIIALGLSSLYVILILHHQGYAFKVLMLVGMSEFY